MKLTPMSGPSMPSQDISPASQTADKIIRAKQIAAGQTPTEQTGNVQADRIQNTLNKIKMKTQVSPDRDYTQELTTPETQAQAQSPNLDTNVEAKTVEETKPLSPQFAAIAKAKRALQVKERELAEREAKLNSQGVQTTQEDLIAKLKANPLSVLQENGVTYEQLTEAILSNPANPEILQLKNELKALKDELTQQFTTRDKQAVDQVKAELRDQALELSKEGETYQFIREADMVDDVIQGIEDQYYETGKLADLTETMNKLEDRLVQNALKAAQFEKIKAKLTPSQPETPQIEQSSQNPNVRVMKTLTSRDGARPIGTDRRSRALAAFHGQKIRG